MITYQQKYYLENKKLLNKKHKEYYLEHKKEAKIRRERYSQEQKEIMHNLKINGCSICGYRKYDSCLEFHHVNPEDKCFYLKAEKISCSPDKMIDEIHKCILLCKNCHLEIHAKERGEKKNE